MGEGKGLKQPERIIFYEAAADSVKNGKHQVNTGNYKLDSLRHLIIYNILPVANIYSNQNLVKAVVHNSSKNNCK